MRPEWKSLLKQIRGEARAGRLRSRATLGRGRMGGQTVTEYMMVISVIVIALAAVSYSVEPQLKDSFNKLLGAGSGTSSSDQMNVPAQVKQGYVTANPIE